MGALELRLFVDPTVMSTAPAIHVRDGRMHFKFGDTKSVFYLTDTDLDISPPRRAAGLEGGLRGTAGAHGSLGARPRLLRAEGRWFVAPERVDMDLQLDRTGLGEMTALAARPGRQRARQSITSRLHLGGPINNIGIRGRLTVEDVHRWDLLPPHGQGWPLDISGRLDLIGSSSSCSPGRPATRLRRFRRISGSAII